ncbi:SH3 domain-containing protein [Oceanobacillus jeddahense]|uniref:SH3 domain-containing protein n=1 Tax=Oceanobacillus jeddahense TaxID=1462527 RepID=UPI0005963B6D|nr:SH3 domain-containing protein [Oceanobacillus jeddahense]
MRKSSKFRLLLLFIAGIVFIVFVLIMQRQFNNPDFDFQNEVSEVNEIDSDEEETEEEANSTDEDTDSDEESDNSESEEEADAEADNSNGEDFEVTADLLNIRSSPSADSEVVATLVTGDIVQVIGEEDEYEWVEVTYQDVTGYANAGYLEAIE